MPDRFEERIMLTANYQYLLSPLNIRGTIFQNRIFKNTDSGMGADLSVRIADSYGFTYTKDHIDQIPEPDILKIPEIYAQEALRVKKEGYQICVISGMTGTLLGDFLSPARNRRADRWGGDLENRVRLGLRIIEKIREAAGDGLLIEFRISGAEFIPDGYTSEEGIEIAKRLDKKADILYVAAGTDPQKDVFFSKYPSMGILHGCNLRLAGEVRKNVSIPVATAGGLDDPRMMNDIIAAGKADILYSDVYLKYS